MITNANRSGSVRADSKERQHPASHRETRSGSASEHEPTEERREFGRGRPQKIVEVDGRLVLVDAP
jgi:hypothetical protein